MAGRQIAVGLLLVLLVGWFGWSIYDRSWSPKARAREAGGEFLRLAAAGHEEGVQALLSAEAKVSAADSITMYRGMTSTRVHGLRRAQPNPAGVAYILMAGGVPPDGWVSSTLLAMKRENGRWVVVQAGKLIDYAFE